MRRGRNRGRAGTHNCTVGTQAISRVLDHLQRGAYCRLRRGRDCSDGRHTSAALVPHAPRSVALGERVVAVPVANVGVVVEAAQRAIVNRVEIASSFDTTAVEGLMLSPPTEVPVNLVEAGRGPLVLHFLVLQTRSPVRLLAGVVVEPTAHAGNDLTTWRFVNNKLVASTHVVSF